MNLFKRARSTTGRVSGGTDQQPQPSSRSPQGTSRVPGLGLSSLPYATQDNYASNPALSRKITYRTHEESASLFDPFVFRFLLFNIFILFMQSTTDPSL